MAPKGKPLLIKASKLIRIVVFVQLLRCPQFSVWEHSLAIPFYFAVISSLIFALHVVFTSRPVKSLVQQWTRSNELPVSEPHSIPPPYYRSSIFTEIKERTKRHGGTALFFWEICRLIGCVLLLSLSVYTAVSAEESRGFGSWAKGRFRDRRTISHREMQDLGLCLASVRFPWPSNPCPAYSSV